MLCTHIYIIYANICNKIASIYETSFVFVINPLLSTKDQNKV